MTEMRLIPKQRPEADNDIISDVQETGARQKVSKHEFMRRHEEAMEWVLRLNAADVTPAERLAFAGWLASDRAHASAFHRAKRLHWMATHPLTPQGFRLQDAPPPQAANTTARPDADAPAEEISASATAGDASASVMPNHLAVKPAVSRDALLQAPMVEPASADAAATDIHAEQPSWSPRPMRRSTLEKLAQQQSAMRELTAREARHVALPHRMQRGGQKDAGTGKGAYAIGRVAALAVVAGLAAFLIADGPMRLRADLVSTSKEMPRITLPDGSQVQLDSGSAIDVAYDITVRRIRLLRGEAFFQVARDATRPFVVEAQNGTVTGGVITDDSGTPSGAGFDLRLTKAGAVVTVSDQVVSVAPPDKPNGDQYAPVELQAGQRIAYGLDGSMSPIRMADPQQTASWRRGRLEVENQSLASVIEQIDRHSPAPIIILGSSLGQRRVSGSFDLSHPREAVDMLAQRFNLHAVHVGPLLTVLRD
ncbi:FecR family protein [Dongia soli]|uniref:DUF4880 domain-containing protein n=1 Tax=Dongia soli TaxID=600628 RepID=A0ABU5EEJ7_9PROT|nr:FecR domain-containing protein [Dongia soli]MDY0884636.1 DUF4880 domain-containing protein [Dongia soli]